MQIDERLAVVDAYLDGARVHMDRVDPTPVAPFVVGTEARELSSASRRPWPVSVSLERARTYVRAAQQTIGDVADDLGRGSIGRAGEDLRLLEQLCAMVDELGGLAARTLAAAAQDPAAPEVRDRGLLADLGNLGQVRSSAQAAERLEGELAAEHRRALSATPDPAAQRLHAEQQGSWAASSPAGGGGVPR